MYRAVLLFLVFIPICGCIKEKIDRKVINTDQAPQAIGPYSQAIQVGKQIFLSGQIAIDPNTGAFIPGGIKEQTQQVLKNIQAVLHVSDFNMQDIVQVQIFLTDMNNYGVVNQIYAAYFNEEPPARAVVQVARLPKDALIEIMVSAIKT